ncbi:polysaccharide deacetylase family protein [Novosphingobium sp. G106]|nr:polysaccharide deacetylase family protein [Novosphingobium sp. G106]MBV1687693.1 polysaccharide deacetylase family protein [Novosphingobium sp. G106]
MDRPAAPEFVRFPAGTPPRFLVTIDTEEEFDWAAPLRREGHGLATIPSFARFVQFCESFGVVPLFLIDYPIATAPATAEVLGPALAAGKAEIGVHLHPWVNPPFDEDLSEFNSFPGNLPEAVEREKFRDLRDAIRANLGVAPQIYRAGRYGAGPNTAAILRETGIAIDTSVRALFDYSSTGGPNYRDHPRRPYWLGEDKRLLELPVTTVYGGLLRRWGAQIYPQLWRGPRLRGAMAHARLLERIPLTPEGITPAEAKRGIDAALAENLPLLTFSFHSPSLAPGHTPYVRTPADLDVFYDWWREIFAHLARRGVAGTSVRDLAASLGLAQSALAEPALA